MDTNSFTLNLTALAIALGSLTPCPAQSDEAGLASEIESAEITPVVGKFFPADSDGGLAVLVIDNGKILHQKGYGLKDGKTPITAQTKMGLASVSKQFAAMCAALLIEEGKLNLTDKVSKHLPDLTFHKMAEQRELLVQDLLWHTSGLANFINAAEKESIARYKKKHGLTWLNNRTHAEWLATQSLRRAPGVEWQYTNSGYVLLTRIIEVITGKPFHEFQQQRIFDALGMTDTTDSKRFNGSGNMSTTLEDYAKWDRALWDGTLLGAATSQLLFRSGTLDNGEPVDYGFGWRLGHEESAVTDEVIEVFHGGVGSAPRSSRNFVLRDLRHRITVVFFAQENLTFTKTKRAQFAREIRDRVLMLKSSDLP